MKSISFTMRFPVADRDRLRELAELAQRSESDVVRVLIRAARPDHVTPGIVLSHVEDEPMEIALLELRAA